MSLPDRSDLQKQRTVARFPARPVPPTQARIDSDKSLAPVPTNCSEASQDKRRLQVRVERIARAKRS